MNATIHRYLVAIALVCAGFAPILTADDATGLGISPDVGKAFGLAAALIGVLATAVRANTTEE